MGLCYKPFSKPLSPFWISKWNCANSEWDLNKEESDLRIKCRTYRVSDLTLQRHTPEPCVVVGHCHHGYTQHKERCLVRAQSGGSVPQRARTSAREPGNLKTRPQKRPQSILPLNLCHIFETCSSSWSWYRWWYLVMPMALSSLRDPVGQHFHWKLLLDHYSRSLSFLIFFCFCVKISLHLTLMCPPPPLPSGKGKGNSRRG